MKQNYEAVGFLPMPVVEKYLAANQLWFQYENNEPCGYLIFGNGYPVCKVYQCCIQTDARRQNAASLLIRALIDRCNHHGFSSISLWCAEDLESNMFWQSMGFLKNGTRQGGKHRQRVHNHWVLKLTDSNQLHLF